MPVLNDIVFCEGFMLMKYRSTANGRVEWVWNSRDGIAPFAIPDLELFEKTGQRELMQHADWGEDVRVPNYVPPLGSRIFVNIDGFDHYKHGVHNVTTVVVDEAIRHRFQQHAETTPWTKPRRRVN